MQVVASGKGKASFQLSSMSGAVAFEENAPEGAQFQLDLTFGDLVLPSVSAFGHTFGGQVVVGGARIAQAVAGIVNGASELHGIHLWPGHRLAEASGPTVSVRWVKGEAWLAKVVAVLTGISVGIVLDALGILTGAAAAAAGFLAALVVYVVDVAWQLWVNLSRSSPEIVPFLVVGGVALLLLLAVGFTVRELEKVF